MIWAGQIQNCVADGYRQFFVRPEKFPGQWMILGFDNYPFSDPLPKLGLRCPKMVSAVANNQCIPFFLFLIFVVHLFILLVVINTHFGASLLFTDTEKQHAQPRREASHSRRDIAFETQGENQWLILYLTEKFKALLCIETGLLS